MGIQTETWTPRATDLGGQGFPEGPAGAPGRAGGGENARRLGRCMGGSGRPLPKSGLMARPPRGGGEGSGRGGSAPPPLLRGPRAGKPCRSAPPPPGRALSRSPPSSSSGSRRVGTAPFSPPPRPPSRLCVWRNWGTTGGGLAGTPWGEGDSVAVLLSGFPTPRLRPHFPSTGAPGFWDPFGEVVPCSPREEPGFRMSAGGPREGNQALDRPSGATADSGGF